MDALSVPEGNLASNYLRSNSPTRVEPLGYFSSNHAETVNCCLAAVRQLNQTAAPIPYFSIARGGMKGWIVDGVMPFRIKLSW